MTRSNKRRVTSSKVPQKVALPAYHYSPAKSPSPDESPLSPDTDASDRGEPTPPGTPDQDHDANDSGTDYSHTSTTSSSGDFPRIPVRPRQRFTAEETNALEQVYRRNKRPTNEIKQRLARRFTTSVSRIQIWFQNRRAKEKKGSNPRTSTSATAGEQDGDNDDDNTPSDDPPEQAESSTSAAASSSKSKRQRTSRKPSASPATVADSSSSADRKRKKQKVPTVPTSIPVASSFLPSGGYAFAYPGFAAPSMQSMNPPNTSNTPIPNEGFLYQGHPPSHTSHARGGFFFPKFDWSHPNFIHPSYPPAFQGPQPNEKPLKYVDPKKVVKPDSSQPVANFMNERDATTSNSSRSLSRKGKQKQTAADLMDSVSEQSSSEEEAKGDL